MVSLPVCLVGHFTIVSLRRSFWVMGSRTLFLSVLIVSVIAVSSKRRTDPGESCPPNQCCLTNLSGFYFSVCPTGRDGVVSILNHPIPSVIQAPNSIEPSLYHGHQTLSRNLPRSNDFTLKLLSINIWGFMWPMSEDRDLRVAKITEFLKSSDYDIVFMQEAWMYGDFQKIKSIFPYSTYFGSPNSVFCPIVK